MGSMTVRSLNIAGENNNNYNNLNGSSEIFTSASSRIDMDEYISFLRDKLKCNSHEIRMKFKNADSEGKGGVSKEAFAHIIAAILGPTKPLSHQNFLIILDRLNFKNRSIIK